ncbi:potassium channel family protein [Nocardioides sp. zg-DK7169]|uniref:potassium channel family protein n=1 Tax=Nocardioides sp. zg-DK7169 TaxID=2736600 RepID=UPI001C13203D|nr:potassium channel family protein [Nocardioides sp. zg-DK7169]
MAEDSSPGEPAPGHRDRWRHPAWASVGVLVVYFAVPLGEDSSGAAIAGSLLLTAAGLALVGTAMVLELRRVRAGSEARTAGVLTVMVVVLVAAFSLAFYLLELLAPRQFEGLSTRTDALYFTLSTMATVGYGDVHALGQVARGMVCGLIVFSVAVVATLVRSSAQSRGPR